MTNKVKIVVKGFIELSDTEKKDFIDEIKKYIGKNIHEQIKLRKSFSGDVKRILGPTSMDNCPCCGK